MLADNDVDLDILPDLTEQDFEKLGISLGHRRKLLKAIATLRDTAKNPPGKPEQEPVKSRSDRAGTRSRAATGHGAVQRPRGLDGAGHRA